MWRFVKESLVNKRSPMEGLWCVLGAKWRRVQRHCCTYLNEKMKYCSPTQIMVGFIAFCVVGLGAVGWLLTTALNRPARAVQVQALRVPVMIPVEKPVHVTGDSALPRRQSSFSQQYNRELLAFLHYLDSLPASGQASDHVVDSLYQVWQRPIDTSKRKPINTPKK